MRFTDVRFTEEKIEAISANLDEKKKAKGINTIGMGVNLRNASFNTSVFFKDNWQLCEIEDISRLIEELEMLRDAITEEAGIEF